MFKRLFIKWTNGIVHWFSLKMHYSLVRSISFSWRRAKKKKCEKISNSFLDFRISSRMICTWQKMRLLTLAHLRYVAIFNNNSRTMCTMKKRVTGITSATMTTMNHIELGHGHTEASALLLFPISHICNYFYKNSTHQIPSSIDCQNQFVCTDSHFHPARRRIIARISMKKNIAFYAFLVITNVQWV